MQASSSILKKRSSSQETKRSTENITRIVETVGHGVPQSKYKSTQSLHELGLDNYPNPEMPESSRLTRKEEKLSLQNLNNRLAGNYTTTQWIFCLFLARVEKIARTKLPISNMKIFRQIATRYHKTTWSFCNPRLFGGKYFLMKNY